MTSTRKCINYKIALLGGGRAVTHVTPTRKMDVFHFRRRRVGQLLSLLGVARPCCFFLMTQTDRFCQV